MKKIRWLMNPHTGAVDIESNWRAGFKAYLRAGPPSNDEDSSGEALLKSLEGYDPLHTLVEVVPDGKGGWKEKEVE